MATLPHSPRLGIFWFVRLSDEYEFLEISTPIEQVALIGGFKTTEESHIAGWKKLATKDRRLSRYSYEYFPRGRVNWREDDDSFLLLADINILRNNLHQKVIEGWNLPVEKVIVQTDAHYRTNSLPTIYDRRG